MRTDELINTLVADHAVQPRPKPIAHGLAMAIVGGLAISLALFLLTLGVRPDIVSALSTWRFDLKLSVNVVLAIAASLAAVRLSSPTTTPLSAMRALLVPALLLFGAVVYELVTIPASAWPSRAIGVNGVMCLGSIISLSVLPLIATIYALRQGAPTSPAVMGAVGGLLAGTLGATIFAMHCTSNSPLFLAIWYALAIGLMSTFGLLVGRHALRW